MSMSHGVVPDDGVGFRRGGRFAYLAGPGGPSMTKQEFADECDINNIMARYIRDGLLMHVNRFQGEYMDVTGSVDFHAAQNAVLAAEHAFMSLPSKLRTMFDNDPGKFLEFATNPDNREKMGELGLLKEVSDGREVSRPVVRSDDPRKPDGAVADAAASGSSTGSK